MRLLAELDFRNKIQTVMAEGQRSYMRMVENAPPLLGTEEQRKRFFILSFDGGGMRGLMSAILLERLLEVFPLFLERVNLVAGCSNGAMISTAIAFNIPPSVSRTLMEITGPTIFGNPESKLMNVRQAKFEVCCKPLSEQESERGSDSHHCTRHRTRGCACFATRCGAPTRCTKPSGHWWYRPLG